MVSSIFIAALLMATGDHAAINPLFRELLDRGIAPDGKSPVTIADPLVADGQSVQEQKVTLAKIVGDRYPVDEFIRQSVVAPFVLKLSKTSTADVAARGVDLWFVVYGDLDKVAKDDILKEFTTARGKDATIHVLTAAELKARGIPAASGSHEGKLAAGQLAERYAYSVVNILDRVELHQTSRCLLSRTDESVVIAMLVDHRFGSDAEFPNYYRRLLTSDTGEKVKGPPQRYASGTGGYLKATQLKDPQGAILVEYHSIYTEPQDWFNGANLLQSKLPILLQSRVRDLRRELRKQQ